MNKTEVCGICGVTITERNHWQKRHQPKHRPEHSEKLKIKYTNGESTPWNLGLTKETHSSLKQQSESLKKYFQNHEPAKAMLGKHHSEETRRKMSESHIGERNGNWKGGVTEGVRLFRKSRRYQQWRRAVLRRDQHICQVCGTEGVNIAHHIKSVKNHPSLRFELDNGVAVCYSCHNQIHKRK